MPDKTIQLTPAQAQRLIDTYCYVTEPDAVERLTRGALTLYQPSGCASSRQRHGRSRARSPGGTNPPRVCCSSLLIESLRLRT